MTPAQKKKAVSLLRRCLQIKEAFDAGQAVDIDVDDKLTTDVRVFLIEVGAIPDRRKKP